MHRFHTAFTPLLQPQLARCCTLLLMHAEAVAAAARWRRAAAAAWFSGVMVLWCDGSMVWWQSTTRASLQAINETGQRTTPKNHHHRTITESIWVSQSFLSIRQRDDLSIMSQTKGGGRAIGSTEHALWVWQGDRTDGGGGGGTRGVGEANRACGTSS